MTTLTLIFVDVHDLAQFAWGWYVATVLVDVSHLSARREIYFLPWRAR